MRDPRIRYEPKQVVRKYPYYKSRKLGKTYICSDFSYSKDSFEGSLDLVLEYDWKREVLKFVIF